MRVMNYEQINYSAPSLHKSKGMQGSDSFSMDGNVTAPITSNTSFPPLLMTVDGIPVIFSTTNEGGSMATVKDSKYTDENPLIRVKGVDSKGVPYDVSINPLEVDIENASSVEMAALTAYLMETGKIDEFSPALVRDHTDPVKGKADIFQKANFKESISLFASWQKNTELHDTYLALMDILDTMLETTAEGRKDNSSPESKTQSTVFTNPAGEKVLMVKANGTVRYMKLSDPTPIELQGTNVQADSEFPTNVASSLEAGYFVL